MIFTLGHSTHSPERFIELLRGAGASAVADVRSIPGSRRYPHFDSEVMARWLAEAGIGYVHIPELGGHRKATPDGGFTTIRNAGFRGYAQYVGSPEFLAGIDRLEDGMALVCAEAVWWRCHRRLIAEWLVMHSRECRHVLPSGLVVPKVDLLDGGA